jgi:AbrB family looped-hinge helix DNA binding protein
MSKRRLRTLPAAGATRRWLSHVGPGGRVVVPAELRGALGLKEGDAVVFEATGNQIAFKSHSDIVRAIQEKYSKRLRAPEHSVDAFLADRKALWGEE